MVTFSLKKGCWSKQATSLQSHKKQGEIEGLEFPMFLSYKQKARSRGIQENQ